MNTPPIEQEDLKKMEAEAKAILANIAKSSPDDLKVALAFTPHARGSTLLKITRAATWIVYPACAGIDR